MRRHAAEVLGRIGGDQATEALIGKLHDPSALVRERAAEALATLARPEASYALQIVLVADTSAGVRALAAEALGKIHGKGAVVQLLLAMPGHQRRACAGASRWPWAASTAAGPCGPSSGCWATRTPGVRCAAADALAHLGSRRALEPLAKAMRDPDPCVRWHAADAMSTPGRAAGRADLPQRAGGQPSRACAGARPARWAGAPRGIPAVVDALIGTLRDGDANGARLRRPGAGAAGRPVARWRPCASCWRTPRRPASSARSATWPGSRPTDWSDGPGGCANDHNHRRRRQGRHRQDHAHRPADPLHSREGSGLDPGHRRGPGQQPELGAGHGRWNAPSGDVREDTADKARPGKLEPGMAKQDILDYEINSSLVEGDGVDLLAMGRPEGPGCYCAANNMLRTIVDRMTKAVRLGGHRQRGRAGAPVPAHDAGRGRPSDRQRPDDARHHHRRARGGPDLGAQDPHRQALPDREPRHRRPHARSCWPPSRNTN